MASSNKSKRVMETFCPTLKAFNMSNFMMKAGGLCDLMMASSSWAEPTSS